MQSNAANISMHCKVCAASGYHQEATTHFTRGSIDPYSEQLVLQGGWSLMKPLGKTTTCPILANTVCTNPLCFNGQDGVIRFPQYGHSQSYCPCRQLKDVWDSNWNPPNVTERSNQGLFCPVFQFPIPINELYLEDIWYLEWCQEIDEWMQFLDEVRLEDDFIISQEMEETNSIYNQQRQIQLQIQKLQKKLKKVENAKYKYETSGYVEKNQEELLLPDYSNQLKTQIENLKKS